MKRISFLGGMILSAVVAAHGFGQDIEAVGRNLKEAVRNENTKNAEEHAKHLTVFNSAKAAEALLNALQYFVKQELRNDTLYWVLVKAAASFSNAEPLEEVAKFIITFQKQAVSRDIMFMMANNYAHDAVYLCIRVLDKATDELKVMAVDHMGVLQHKEAVAPLIEALKKNTNPEVKRRIAKALGAITSQDYGDNVTNWEGWWNANKDKEIAGAGKGEFGGGNVMTGLDKPRENEIEKTKKLPPDAIVVIRGGDHDPREKKRNGGKGVDHNFDHIENTLAKISIPHICITKEEFEKDDFKLEGRMMVLINCTQWREHCVCEDCTPSADPVMRLYKCKCSKTPEVHYPLEYKFSDKAVQKIKKFVDSGGYLFTEDWVLEELLARKDAWPDLVKVGEYMKEQTVGILPKAGSTSHPYLKRIFAKPPRLLGKGTGIETAFDEIKHTWKIDLDSPKIKVVDPKKVVTLMMSKELGVDEAVAVTFGSGKGGEVLIGTGKAQDLRKLDGGRVLHVLSHFGKQKSESDEYTLQNLLVNFLIEATERFGFKGAVKLPGKEK
jgi:HEPN domain-containing protein